MKKMLIFLVLMIAGCANNANDPQNVVTLLSYEKYTDLFINKELQ